MDNKKKVIVSAPGKIHLMGEHAVVHGKPALLSAINLRLYAEVTSSSEFTIDAPETKLIEKAVEIVCSRFKIVNPKVTIKITSSIPTGRHVGSSAAVSVATIGALLYFFKKIWNPNLINELAYEVEKVQHGNPPGADNTTVTFGGLIWFRKELDFLKSIWQLPIKIPSLVANLQLIDTGRPKETTGEMVSQVGKFIMESPQKAQKLLDDNEKATKQVAYALKNNDQKLFQDAIKKGSQTLEGLGVVSKKSKILIKEIEKAGGAAKILGGGGKKDATGLILTYHQNKEIIKKIAKKFSYPTISVKLGEEGVRLESGKNK